MQQREVSGLVAALHGEALLRVRKGLEAGLEVGGREPYQEEPISGRQGSLAVEQEIGTLRPFLELDIEEGAEDHGPVAEGEGHDVLRLGLAARHEVQLRLELRGQGEGRLKERGEVLVRPGQQRGGLHGHLAHDGRGHTESLHLLLAHERGKQVYVIGGEDASGQVSQVVDMEHGVNRACRFCAQRILRDGPPRRGREGRQQDGQT